MRKEGGVREAPSLGPSLLGAPKLSQRKMHGKKNFYGLKILKIHESKNETKTLVYRMANDIF